MKPKKKKLKGIDIAVNCPVCGQPITHANEYGMFCDNECELEESKEAGTVLMPWIEAMGKEMEEQQKLPEDKKLSPFEFMAKMMQSPESQALEEYAKKKK